MSNYHVLLIQAVNFALQSGDYKNLDIILSMPDFSMYQTDFIRGHKVSAVKSMFC